MIVADTLLVLKRTKNIVLVVLVLGVAFGITIPLVRGVVDAFVFCSIVWVLCCASLLVTVKLLIKECEQISKQEECEDIVEDT